MLSCQTNLGKGKASQGSHPQSYRAGDKGMDKLIDMLRNRNALAWVLMTCAGTLHVIDEAANGFLSFYNPLVLDLRERLSFFPAPTFSTDVWLGGLIGAIILSFLITPTVHRGGRFIRIIVTVIGVIMVFNGLGHTLGSVYLGRLLPGFWSSPILLLTAIYVVKRGFGREGWQIHET